MGAVCSHPNLDPSFSAPFTFSSHGYRGVRWKNMLALVGVQIHLKPSCQLSSVRKTPARLPSPLQTRCTALQTVAQCPSSCGPDSAPITGATAMGGQQSPQPGASQ